MDKEFLMDGTKIRFCDSNIAKMNWIQYIKSFKRNRLQLLGELVVDSIKELSIVGLLVVVTAPISVPLMILNDARVAIKRAKRNVQVDTARRAKEKESQIK